MVPDLDRERILEWSRSIDRGPFSSLAAGSGTEPRGAAFLTPWIRGYLGSFSTRASQPPRIGASRYRREVRRRATRRLAPARHVH